MAFNRDKLIGVADDETTWTGPRVPISLVAINDALVADYKPTLVELLDERMTGREGPLLRMMREEREVEAARFAALPWWRRRAELTRKAVTRTWRDWSRRRAHAWSALCGHECEHDY